MISFLVLFSISKGWTLGGTKRNCSKGSSEGKPVRWLCQTIPMAKARARTPQRGMQQSTTTVNNIIRGCQSIILVDSAGHTVRYDTCFTVEPAGCEVFTPHI